MIWLNILPLGTQRELPRDRGDSRDPEQVPGTSPKDQRLVAMFVAAAHSPTKAREFLSPIGWVDRRRQARTRTPITSSAGFGPSATCWT
jgi:hypothetical protein